MAFICPHCNATSGDFFLQEQFANDEPEATVSGRGPRTAVAYPHWCVASKDHCCVVPPKKVLDTLAQNDTRNADFDPPHSVAPMPQFNHRSAISAMLGIQRPL
jgi:hypothetical protein